MRITTRCWTLTALADMQGVTKPPDLQEPP